MFIQKDVHHSIVINKVKSGANQMPPKSESIV